VWAADGAACGIAAARKSGRYPALLRKYGAYALHAASGSAALAAPLHLRLRRCAQNSISET